MPYQPRDLSAGLFHVFTHCVWAAPHLFRDDVDRLEFLRHLARVTGKRQWTCVAYCLMSSHYHLIVDVDAGALPAAMHALNLPYALHHNRRHGLRGHVQFARYGSRRLHDDDELLSAFAYVVRNPVDAGLCDCPEEWPWSSYASTIGLAEPSSFVSPLRVLASASRPGLEPAAVLRARVDGL